MPIDAITQAAPATQGMSAQAGLRERANDLGMRSAGRLAVVLDWLCGRRAGQMIGIVTYHRIAYSRQGVPKPSSNVEPRRFRSQLEGLLSRGFSFVSLRAVLAARETGEPLPQRTAVITFDDGFQSVYTNAWPVLRELRVPATIFVSTAYLDSDAPFPFDDWGITHQRQVPADDYRPLTTAHCREMLADGNIDIGAHTHTHRDLRLRVDEFQQDLQISVDDVRARFGTRDVTFAFPFGSPYLGYAGGELANAARRTSVLCALTTECVPVELHGDPFTWGRFNAFCWDTGATLAAKLNGWYSWAPQLRQRVAKSIFRRVGFTKESAVLRNLNPSRTSGQIDAPVFTSADAPRS
jgi:peptidoglycan/xylan/chitin deacetylase (PgdA/CDA1 family)